MFVRNLPVVLFLLAGCEPSDPQLDIDVTMSPVIAQNATDALIVLFAASPPNACEVLRLSEKNAIDKAQLGTYRSPMTLRGTMAQQANLFDLVPGEYQVAVYVYDAGKKLVGFGCQMVPVRIEEGKRTESTRIEIRPPPA